MPLIQDFKETIRARAQADPEFRRSLLREAVEIVIDGDLPAGKAVLRDYVNATVGFNNLEKQTHIPAKSHADAWTERQPIGGKPFNHIDRSAKERRRSFRAVTEVIAGCAVCF